QLKTGRKVQRGNLGADRVTEVTVHIDLVSGSDEDLTIGLLRRNRQVQSGSVMRDDVRWRDDRNTLGAHPSRVRRDDVIGTDIPERPDPTDDERQGADKGDQHSGDETERAHVRGPDSTGVCLGTPPAVNPRGAGSLLLILAGSTSIWQA